VDARSDLYSVGIMLFQLLTGRLPFDADSPLAIAYAHVQEEPVAPSSVNRSVTPAMDALVARALKKNPNERFPSAAAMRDECLRVLSAGQTGAPMIVAGGPVQSGSGVGSAVFPPVGQTPPPSAHGVQTTYQPTPQPGPYGAPTPAPSYGYPQQVPTPPPAYQTPPPASDSQAPAPVPGPYTVPQQQAAAHVVGGGSSANRSKIALGAMALLLVAGVVTGIALYNRDPGDEPTANGPSQSSSAAPGHKGPDLTKTIATKKCTEPRESSSDPDKFEVPDFTYKNIQSVKDCLQAAGWKVKSESSVDEATYGQGTVITQYPRQGTDIAKDDAEFDFQVSTGNPPQ
ncbi:serine/threonine protein kinase, partial [Streptomyces platensis subsp. clarensis]|nr:serine/threonine protein kinase [Streptomyces platensis subsp. clarensis]